MQLFGGCGFCEKCVILASMAGVVQNAVVPTDADLAEQAIQNLAKSSLMEEPSLVYGDAEQLAEDSDNGYNEQKMHNVEKKRDYGEKANEPTAVESWCVIWYLGAFGCLVCFFLVITCTELFFGNPLYRTDNLNSFVHNIVSNEHKSYVPDTPPPPYHLFAPPDYNETIQKIVTEKRKTLEVFVVVPVHAAHSSCAPPAPSAPPAYENAVSKMAVNDKFTVVTVPEAASSSVA